MVFNFPKSTKYVLGGAVLSIGGAMICKRLIEANFQRQPFYIDTIKLFDGYPDIDRLLGLPTRQGTIHLGKHELNYCRDLEARVAIPVHGKKKTGHIHSWSSRVTKAHKWQVNKCDLEIGRRRWTFFLHPNVDSEIYRVTTNEDNDIEPGVVTEAMNKLAKRERSDGGEIQTDEFSHLEYFKAP